MKQLFFRLPFLILPFLAGPARADFNPAVVSADSRWVVYANLDALRTSAVGKQLLDYASRMQEGAGAGPVRFSINVPKVLATIGSITAYGANFSKEPKLINGTLVAQGTPDMRKIVEALLIQANVSDPDKVAEVKDLGYDAYAVSPPKDNPGASVVIAFPPEPIVIVSKSEDQVRRARALFRGEGASLAQDPASPLRSVVANSAHAMVFGASVVLPGQAIPGNGPQSRILHMANSVSVALGEEGDKTFAHVRLLASSDDMADRLTKIVEGMTAMMSLGESSDQALNDFLNSAVVARKDDTVTLNLAYSSQRLAEMVGRMVASAAPPRPFGPQHPIGKVVATWNTGPDIDQPEWLKASDVALANGCTITLEVAATPRNAVNFDRMRIVPSGSPDGAPALLAYSRDSLKEVHEPFAWDGKVSLRFFQLWFPGESGNYTIEVHGLPAVQGKLSIGVKNPPGGTPGPKPEHDDAADSNPQP